MGNCRSPFSPLSIGRADMLPSTAVPDRILLFLRERFIERAIQLVNRASGSMLAEAARHSSDSLGNDQ